MDFAETIEDSLKENGTLVIKLDRNSEVWKDPSMRSLTRRWQLQFVDVEASERSVRWHETAPREAWRIVTNSANRAHEIMVGKMRKVESTLTGGATFEKLEKLERWKSQNNWNTWNTQAS